MLEHRTGSSELRLRGRRLEGVALRYREKAKDRPEMFLPGAFAPLPGTVPLNLQHDNRLRIGSAELSDTAAELRMASELPPGSGVHDLVARGALAGLSVEFRAIQEETDAGTRIIQRAALEGLAVVDEGSYETSIEARRLADPPAVELRQKTLRGRLRYGVDRTIEQTGRVRKRRYSPGSLDDAIGDNSREISLSIGRSRTAPGSVIATKLARPGSGGLLTLEVLPAGAGIAWEVSRPAATAAYLDLEKQIEAGVRIESHPVNPARYSPRRWRSPH